MVGHASTLLSQLRGPDYVRVLTLLLGSDFLQFRSNVGTFVSVFPPGVAINCVGGQSHVHTTFPD